MIFKIIIFLIKQCTLFNKEIIFDTLLPFKKVIEQYIKQNNKTLWHINTNLEY